MASANTIFFSYSRSDSEFVLNLAKNLRKAGANIWLDQLDIKPGNRWDSSIEKALEASQTLLVILSCASVKSHNVMDEVSYALEEQKTVVPVLLEECDIPFRLRRLQYADFSKDHKIGVETLIKALNLDNTVALKLADVATENPPEAKKGKTEAPGPKTFTSVGPGKTLSESEKQSPIASQNIQNPQKSKKKVKTRWPLLVGAIVGIGIIVSLVAFFSTSIDNADKNSENKTAEVPTDSLQAEKGNTPEIQTTGTAATDTDPTRNTKDKTNEKATTSSTVINEDVKPSIETITIEGQIWTAKNVDVKTANAICYGNDPFNCKENGALYTFRDAIEACKKLGDGWRLPNDFDWKRLTRAYGGAAGDLNTGEKSGKESFKALVKGGTTNFKGALAGKRIYNTDNFYFYDYNRIGYYWSITRKKPHEDNEAIVYIFRIDDETLLRGSMPVTDFASCRCIKD
ncbi:TIR domain-containing protein [Aequorivita todarodis]|uniref:TIR domain-containing protein n=1 Tax=Aequorivita todarodis TaxID=2036821 RepID=UPI0023510240|nr:TIR domain-containing protein [Aequorivita todarodis]MDC7999849.1 TIR domain-containing protein [Aequorivita todarodis]